MLNYSEAKEESEQLSRVHNRNVEIEQINCTCDYSPQCWKCAGQGYFFKLFFAYCGHDAEIDPQVDCEESDCAEREAVQRDVEIKAVESPRLNSLSESQRDEAA
jgi:hypothetical protein